MGKPFFENVTVLTGATAGIGRELALLLADQGAWLVLAARNPERLEEVAVACRERGGRALAVPTDVMDEAACKALIDRTLAEYGKLDTMINNAGVSMWSPFEEIKQLKPLEDILRVNLFGAMYCSYYALPHLRKSSGRLVGVSSLAGRTGIPKRAIYSAAKHAVTGFFDSLRIELMDSPVSVTTIFPGFVATEGRRRAFGADGKPLGVSPVKEGEIMTAEECARIMLDTISARRREVIMTFRGKAGMWLKLIAPGMVDRMAKKAIETGK